MSGRLLALPAAAVRRLLPLPTLDRPPAAPPVVAGLFRHQGRAVPVLRLDALFGLEASPPDVYAPLLLVERDGRPLALMAGRVFDIVPLPAGALAEVDASLTFNGCAVGTFPHKGASATLLDPARLLTGTEDRLLAAFQTMADERLAQWSTEAQAAEAQAAEAQAAEAQAAETQR